jgi:hypothetical protein
MMYVGVNAATSEVLYVAVRRDGARRRTLWRTDATAAKVRASASILPRAHCDGGDSVPDDDASGAIRPEEQSGCYAVDDRFDLEGTGRAREPSSAGARPKRLGRAGSDEFGRDRRSLQLSDASDDRRK